MPKNIVILCDGTSNTIEKDRTNILRLYGCLEKNDEQLVYYDPGVGTFSAADSPLPIIRKTAEVWGLITGWGLDQNVKEAYRFLSENYDPGKIVNGERVDADQIYLLGYSRGAYTVSVLAGLLHNVGLLEPRNLNLLDYAYRAYKNIGWKNKQDSKPGDGGAFAEVRLYERTLRPNRPAIKMLGLFDTVSSVFELSLRPRLASHANTRKNSSVEHLRHAVAIDERRTMFQPVLWRRDQVFRPNRSSADGEREQDALEVWFTGVHSNIGGGLSEAQSGLTKITAQWMIAETEELGLIYDQEAVDNIILGLPHKSPYEPPNPKGPLYDSMRGLWKILEFCPRRVSKHFKTNRPSFLGLYLPLSERRIIPDGALIHHSVFERRGTTHDVDQPNIPDNYTVIED